MLAWTWGREKARSRSSRRRASLSTSGFVRRRIACGSSSGSVPRRRSSSKPRRRANGSHAVSRSSATRRSSLTPTTRQCIPTGVGGGRRIAGTPAHWPTRVGSRPIARPLGQLTTAPGVGPVTAASFVATVDKVERFRSAHHLESYLGLVPREWSSGEVQRKGHITKAGNTRRSGLVHFEGEEETRDGGAP